MIRSLAQEVLSTSTASNSVSKSLPRFPNDVDLLKQQLLHAQKLASLGTMVGMLAHECNNLLTPIVTYGRFALDSHDPALIQKGMEITLRQAAVIMKMSDRLLGMMVNQPPAYQSVELRPVLERAVENLCRDLAKDGITLNNEVPAGLHVLGDPDALQQLFFNLLLNSRRALLKRKGSITVGAVAMDDRLVQIRFRDTGCGISQDRLPHIFEAFNTSKALGTDEPRKAAGLGLAVCKMIVDDHRGAITVESELNLGTTFIIELPVAIGGTVPAASPKARRSRKVVAAPR